MASRSDSLAARLKRLRLFGEYFAWYLAERPSVAERIAWFAERDVKTSFGAVHALHRSTEAGAWRVEEAKKARHAMDAKLPQGLDKAIRSELLDQRFSMVLGELSHKELMAQLTLENDNERTRLKKEELALKKKDQTKTNLISSLRLQLAKARHALERIASEGFESQKDGVAALLAELEALGVQ